MMLEKKRPDMPGDNVREGFQAIQEGLMEILETLKEIHWHVIVIRDDLRARVERLEKKVGLRS